jgi:hypothetical protein
MSETDVQTMKEGAVPRVGPNGHLRMKRAFRRRDLAEAQAEVTVEDGVRVTRPPEVKGRRIRG